jgi:hypothetical protein
VKRLLSPKVLNNKRGAFVRGILSRVNVQRALSDPRIAARRQNSKINLSSSKNASRINDKKFGILLSKFKRQTRNFIEDNGKECPSGALGRTKKFEIISNEAGFRVNTYFSSCFSPFRESDVESVDPDELKTDSPMKNTPKSPTYQFNFNIFKEEKKDNRRGNLKFPLLLIPSLIGPI